MRIVLGFVLMLGGAVSAVMAAMVSLSGRQAPPGEFLVRIALAFAALLLGGFLISGPPVRSGSDAVEAVAASAGFRKIAAVLSLLVSGVMALLTALALLLETGESRTQAYVALGFVGAVGIPSTLLLLGASRMAKQADHRIRVQALRRHVAALPEETRTGLPALVATLPKRIRGELRRLYEEELLPTDPREAGLACATCGSEGELRHVTLQKFTGLIIFHQTTVTRGLLCGPCIARIAGEYNLHCTLAGWWSIGGIFGTLIALPQNHAAAAAARDLLAPMGPVVLDGASVDRLRPLASSIAELLAAGRSPEAVFRESASRAQTTPGQVCLLIAVLAGIDA